jgi:hypothetical protein
VRGACRLHDAAEQAFDLAPRFLAAFVIVEMHADALGALPFWAPAGVIQTTVPAIGSLAGSSISDSSMKTSSPIL